MTFFSVKQLLVNIIRKCVKPVVCQPVFFIILFLLLKAADVLSYMTAHFFPIFSIAGGVVICYILSVPVIFLRKSARIFYKIVLMASFSILFLVDVFLLLLYNMTFNTMPKDTIAAVLATNPAEASEFVVSYMSMEIVAVIVLTAMVIIIVFFLLRKLKIKISLFGEEIIFSLLVISISLSLYRPVMAFASNYFYLVTKKYPVLADYKQNPTVVHDENSPQTIVVVLGESFSKSNSSLYGYKKETSPLLNTLVKDSILKVFMNVESYSTSTIPSVKSIMTSYTDDMNDSISWYQCLTLLEVVQKCGYETIWLSNQSKSGFYDNEIGAYSDLCDRQLFLGNKKDFAAVRDNSKNFLDEALLKELDILLEERIQSQCKSMFFLHLMGSHAAFNMRYPASFDVFSGNEYDTTHPHLSTKNRQVLAEYDNSILYNDFVVYEILQRFADKEAIVLYFSDHGIDVFQSSNDYIGHAKTNNVVSVKSARQIPFMVYTTHAFKEKFPQLESRIKNSTLVPYRTDSIMYTIMDIAGVETVNGVSYKYKSLFK